MDDTEEVQEEVPEENTTEEPQEEVNAVKADRTRVQIEKLKQHNEELKQERDSYKNLFESIRPAEQIPTPQETQYQNLNQDQINQTTQSMIDENGMLDGVKLLQTLEALDKRATNAETAAAKLIRENQERAKNDWNKEEKTAQEEVYAKYPMLNPENVEGVEVDGELVKFDPKMWQYVFNGLAANAKQGIKPSQSDYMRIAGEVYQDLYEGRDMNKKQKAEADKKQDQKLKINASRPNLSMSSIQTDYYKDAEEEAILKDVQSGKRGSVAALLRQRGQ